MKTNPFILACCCAATAAQAQSWTPLAYPGAINTQAYGVSGNEVVGDYYSSFSPTIEHGYIYNGSSYQTLDDPNAGTANGDGTIITGISGGELVGYYVANGANHGFVHNGSTFTSLNDPFAGTGSGQGTSIYGVSGSNIVGTYVDPANVSHGFVYNGITFTTINAPLAGQTANLGTSVRGISSTGELVGYYVTGNGGNYYSAFTDAQGTFTTLSDPNAAAGQGGTFIFGVSGNELVGGYFTAGSRSHGFTYANGTWTTLDYPGTFEGTYATGVDTNGNVVGLSEIGPNSFDEGFQLTPTPEPSTLTLAAAGVLWLFGLRRRGAKAQV